MCVKESAGSQQLEWVCMFFWFSRRITRD
jgi:hypothetical protein